MKKLKYEINEILLYTPFHCLVINRYEFISYKKSDKNDIEIDGYTYEKYKSGSITIDKWIELQKKHLKDQEGIIIL